MTGPSLAPDAVSKPDPLPALANWPLFRHRWPLLIGLWLVSLSIGFAAMIDYDARPGRGADTQRSWPDGSTMRLAADRMTLVMFLHPHCTCSMASLEELALLFQQQSTPPRLYIVVLHTQPEKLAQASRTVARAAAIQGTVLVSDPDGTESDRFGSHTSGTLLVFAPTGRREYAGGLTLGRGHVGANKARDAAAAALRGESIDEPMPVFGCPLH